MLEKAIEYNLQKQFDLSTICAPLEKSFKINLIHYRRFYQSSGLISLYNHTEWMNIAFQNQYWHSSTVHEKLQQLQNKKSLLYLWPQHPLNDAVHQGLYEHNLWNGITLYKRSGDYIESFAFATTRNYTKAADFYLSEIEMLEHFILYFRSKIVNSITSHIEQEIMIPFSHDISFASDKDEIRNQFLQNTPIDNFYLRFKGKEIKLTKREHECLTYFSLGKKTKEISTLLNLSPRTIETYLKNIKTKSNISNTSQLISIYQENIF